MKKKYIYTYIVATIILYVFEYTYVDKFEKPFKYIYIVFLLFFKMAQSLHKRHDSLNNDDLYFLSLGIMKCLNEEDL